MSVSTAHNCMNAAEWVEANSQSVGNLGSLPPTLLYLLGAKSTPEAVSKAVVTSIEEGKSPTVAAVKKLIADAKPKAAAKSYWSADDAATKTAAPLTILETSKPKPAISPSFGKGYQKGVDWDKFAVPHSAAVAFLADRLGADLPTFVKLFFAESHDVFDLALLNAEGVDV